MKTIDIMYVSAGMTSVYIDETVNIKNKLFLW